MATAVKDPLVGRLVDTRYLVHDRIASGGMATVYLATDTRLERPVALKVMHTHLAADASFVARFTREARSAARLSHPGVVSVYDQGASDGTVYLAMEHVPGRTLRDLVAEAAPLPLGNALDLIEEVLDGLAAAHAAGLVHRDVKPENVLVGDDGRLRVADFGLARAATTATGGATSTLIGTVGYLAPELVLEGASDERADVYAAGVVLFELLTGRAPFAGGAPAQVAFRHVSQDLPAISSVRPGVPQGVDALVAGATERDPSRRPRNAGVMLEQVRALQDSLPDAVLDAAPFVVPDASASPTSARAAHDGTRVHEHADGREHVQALPVGELRDAASAAPPTRAELLAEERGTTRALPRPAEPRQSGRGGPLGLPPDVDEVAPQAPARERRRPRVVVVALLLVLLVVVLGAGGTAAWAYTAGPLARVVVPQLVNRPGSDAESALRSRELVASLTPAPSESVPAGEVVSTDPEAGERVEKDSTVTVVVSSGPQLRLVPDLTGKTQEQAEDALQTSGLAVGKVIPGYSDTVPAGSVVSQQTPVDTPLMADGKVAFTISQGKEPVAAPVLVRRTEEEALKALADAGLKSGKVDHQHDDEVPAGTVISSNPSTGNLHRGDEVSFVVSDGPSTVVVADVTDRSVDDATRALQDQGLEAYEERYTWSDTVREQWPAAGTEVEPGSKVVIKIW